MKRASEIFTDDDRQRIARAVADAEAKTTAEIVPVVATASGRYDRAEDMAGFAAALGAFIIAWLLFQREDPTAGGWDGLPITLQLPILVLIMVAGFVVGAVAATQVAWLRRLLTPRGHLAAEVEERAAGLFSDQRIHHTEAATGVMVFVSLFERRAVVLADEQAFEKLGEGAIDDACRDLTAALRTGDVAAALVGTIEALGERLAAVLPSPGAGKGEPNELPDALVTID